VEKRIKGEEEKEEEFCLPVHTGKRFPDEYICRNRCAKMPKEMRYSIASGQKFPKHENIDG
jgi:hypothetical protein